VHRQRRDHEIERSVWEGILEPGDPELSTGKRLSSVLEHVVALVDADEPSAGVNREDALRGDSRAGAEIEDRPRVQPGSRLRHRVLEAVVPRHLTSHQLEIRVRMEVELVAHARRR
jgi:hypothetical protein